MTSYHGLTTSHVKFAPEVIGDACVSLASIYAMWNELQWLLMRVSRVVRDLGFSVADKGVISERFLETILKKDTKQIINKYHNYRMMYLFT